MTLDPTPILIIRPDSSTEEIAAAQGRIAYLKQMVKDIADQLEDILVEKCEVEGGFIIGETWYYAGTQTDKKVSNIREAVTAIFEASDGDLDSLIGCIASNGLKPGALAGIVGKDKADTLIEIKTRVRLKEGKPAKSLIAVNERFT